MQIVLRKSNLKARIKSSKLLQKSLTKYDDSQNSNINILTITVRSKIGQTRQGQRVSVDKTKVVPRQQSSYIYHCIYPTIDFFSVVKKPFSVFASHYFPPVQLQSIDCSQKSKAAYIRTTIVQKQKQAIYLKELDYVEWSLSNDRTPLFSK